MKQQLLEDQAVECCSLPERNKMRYGEHHPTTSESIRGYEEKGQKRMQSFNALEYIQTNLEEDMSAGPFAHAVGLKVPLSGTLPTAAADSTATVSASTTSDDRFFIPQLISSSLSQSFQADTNTQYVCVPTMNLHAVGDHSGRRRPRVSSCQLNESSVRSPGLVVEFCPLVVVKQ